MLFLQIVSVICKFSKNISRRSTPGLLLAGSLALAAQTQAQTAFLRIQDPTNPITTNATSGHYTGAAWVDYDHDGDLDLFVVDPSGHELYLNDGSGNFTKIITGILVTDFAAAGRGVTWGDYDNDGDLDCFVAGIPSVLYRQDGAGVFSKVTTGDIAQLDNRGWSAGWADYDSDGFLDLVISHPAGFVSGGAATPNHLYHNDGPPNYTFSKIDTGIIVTGLAAYTHGSWYDYDDDGDIDLFMASGPANGSAAPDFLYKNLLKETGAAGFERILDSPIGTDFADGQQWSWIDIDGDLDLDAYLTNWAASNPGTRPNHMYTNDGGSYTRVTTGNIVIDPLVSLANVWGDFDNDGDLDCFVANDGNFGGANRFYLNDGAGVFTLVTTGDIATIPGTNSGATIGDYDDDGDLDLFVCGANSAANRLLFRNELATGAGWLKLDLAGVASNASAIGANVFIKATIGGSPTWMRRDVNASNAFMGHSSLQLHFGLGDASVVDSLIIKWPSGSADTTTTVAINQTLSISESGVVFDAGNRFGGGALSTQFFSRTSENVSAWSWDFGDGESSTEISPSHDYTAPGLYSVTVEIQSDDGQFSFTRSDYLGVHADTIAPVDTTGPAGSTVAVDISIRSFVPITGMVIPFAWSAEFEANANGISFSGLRADGLNAELISIDPFNRRGTYVLTATSQAMAPGDGPAFQLLFDLLSGGADSLIEVTIGDNAQGILEFTSTFGEYIPTGGVSTIKRACCLTAGDANNDDKVNVSDVTFLIARIFAGGSAPTCSDEGDSNGDNSVNISDITYLIARIFAGGPAPICGTTGA